MLSERTLNRALLERQLLLSRSELSALHAVEHLVGMQAQAPQAPYVGLWTRLRDFQPDQLVDLLTERRAVRIALQRGTVHLVTADDCRTIRPIMQPLYERFVGAGGPYGRQLAGIDLTELAGAARTLIEAQPRTNAELRTLLGGQWPDRDPAAVAMAVRSLLACVQVPPRGLWGRSGQARVTTAEAWLGRALETAPSHERLVLRYLAAYGPATVMDMQTWCGLTRLGEVTERLLPRLRVFRDEGGRELLDLPDAPRPSPDAVAPVRFLPAYDNCLRSHADRGRVMSDETRKMLATSNDAPRPTFLVDGFVRGIWRLEHQRRTARMIITPFGPLCARDAEAVTEEGARLLSFAAPAADTRDLQLAAPAGTTG